jgi:hypothetical protein
MLSVPTVGVAHGAVTAHVAKDKDDKGKEKEKGKGKDDMGPSATTPAAPVPAPAPPAPTPGPAPAPAAAPDTGKGKNPKGKDKPGKGPAPAPALPEASTAPTVALDTPLAPPTLGQSVGVAPAAGTVRVRTAQDRDVHVIAGDAPAAIPTGARVDARAGTVELSAATDASGTPQTATFTGAIFEVRQDPAAGGLTRIVLRGGDFRACRATGHRASAAKRKKPVRSLWGQDDHGRFQTRGKGAVGTVRGTRWLTQDFCDGTLTRVVEGSVAVRDLEKRKTVVVRAGHSYFARY